MIAIAIDGPAGAGKSTIAKTVAKELGYIYVDTGALYRAIGFYMLKSGVRTNDTDAISKELMNVKVELTYSGQIQRVILNGEDVSEEIRTETVSMAASDVSAIPAVRDFLFQLQREIAEKNNVVMDGRDIGTVVLPFAQVKLFVTASPGARAERRYKELLQKGMPADFDAVLNDIEIRDYNDSNRAVAPLKPAKDSILVDTTDLNLEQSVEHVKVLIAEKLSAGGVI